MHFRFYCLYLLNDCLIRLEKLLEGIEKKKTGADDDYTHAVEQIIYISIETINALDEMISIFNTSKVMTFNTVKEQIKQSLDNIDENYDDKAAIVSGLNQMIQFVKIAKESSKDLRDVNDNYDRFNTMTETYDPLNFLRDRYPEKIDRKLTFFFAAAKWNSSANENNNIYKTINSLFELDNYIQSAEYMMSYHKDNLSVKPIRCTETEIKEMRISNKVFDILFLPFNFDCRTDYRGEHPINNAKLDLTQYEKYLRPGGTFFTIMPKYRFTKEYSRHLTKFFEKIEINSFNSGHDYMREFYFVSGVRKFDSNTVDDEYADKLLIAHLDGDIKDTKQEEKIKVLLYEEIETFRSMNIDDQDIEEVTEKIALVDTLLDDLSFSNKEDMKPLLPFNTGQIGLVLASGQLDGIVEEEGGYKHVIKGRIVRVPEYSSYEEEGVEYDSVTSSSRVEINVLLPNGEYKTIA